MSATVQLSETNGVSPGVVTDNIANMNFGAFDGPNLVPSAHPINVGSNSVAKWFRIKLAALGGSTQISNLKGWKASGNYLTGELIGGNLLNGGSINYPAWSIAGYAQATVSGGGGAIAVPYTGNGQVIFGGNPFTGLGVITAAPTGSNENITIGSALGGVLNVAGTYSRYFCLALTTTLSTPVGAVNQKVFTFQYDEA